MVSVSGCVILGIGVVRGFGGKVLLVGRIKLRIAPAKLLAAYGRGTPHVVIGLVRSGLGSLGVGHGLVRGMLIFRRRYDAAQRGATTI